MPRSHTPQPDAAWGLPADLREGPAGVKRWNARPLEERQRDSVRGTDLCGADLAGADLGELDFQGANFDEANLAGAFLLEGNFAQASFRGANLCEAWCARACFEEAQLGGANLARANLRGCDFRNARLAGAKLEGAYLAEADLCGADLTAANLSGATLDSVRYDGATRWPIGFFKPTGLEWAGSGAVPVDFDAFLRRLDLKVDSRRLARALEMLKAERFQLYAQVEGDSVAGVVKSQTELEGRVYSCRLGGDGSFACCDQALGLCLGLRGALCKHILVLIVGLVRGGQLDAATVDQWVQASRSRKPRLDTEQLSATLLRYKGAEAGEIDWRPTETIPEDFYSL
jgi:hypothetical protein